LGHGLDVTSDINSVNLMLWKLTETELEQKLNDDSLVQSQLAVIATIYPAGATTGTLWDVTSVGMPLPREDIEPFVDPEGYPPALNTYTVMAATGEELGAGTRMIQAFKLDPNSTNQEVAITDASTELTYTVDLESLEATEVPPASGAVALDWGNMTTNGLGQPFEEATIDLVAVAQYSQPPGELAADFLSLVNYDGSVNADHLWQGEVRSGSSVTLSDLTDDTGAAFPGIDGTSTWMFALFCSTCQNPDPTSPDRCDPITVRMAGA
jgi:hypothetical protein